MDWMSGLKDLDPKVQVFLGVAAVCLSAIATVATVALATFTNDDHTQNSE